MNWWQVIVSCGIPTVIFSFLFWLFERRIAKREDKKEKEQQQREEARKEHEVLTLQSINAAIALGEATAKAVQRIPDAHCNGDMHAALEYAEQIKHEQKNFLTRQGVNNLYSD